MKVLVLGGSGFIGSHVVDTLLENGHSVRVYDRAKERYRDTPEAVEFVPGDLSDTSSLAETLAGIDMVFHLVSTTVPSTANLDPIADIQGNLIASVRLLELMRAQGVVRLLYLSSGGTVYGEPTIDTVPETHQLQPISSYGIVKVAIENYIRTEAHIHGLKPVILRPSNPYGPRQGHGGVQGVIGTFMGRIIAGDPVELWGDGSVIRDFIYVKDLAELCVICAEKGTTGVYNVGAGEGRSMREIVDAIAEVSGQPVEPVMKPGRAFDIPKIVLNISTTHSATGWQPVTSFKDGMAASWAWVQEQQG